MFLTEALVILWKPFLIHLVVFMGFATFAWWVVTKYHSTLSFKPVVPAALGAIFSLGFSAHSLVVGYESRLIGEANQANQASSSANPQSSSQSAAEQRGRLKQELFKTVEALVQNPVLLTGEAKAKLFNEFAPLFPNGAADRRVAGTSIRNVYDCQRVLFEDMLATVKSKKVVKSDNRVACEKADGRFFERETLWTPDAVKQNNETLEVLAKKQRVPASDGTEKPVTPDMLEKNIDASKKASEVVKAIFE